VIAIDGVSRKLKPFERKRPAILPIHLLYLAGVTEKARCVPLAGADL